MPVTYGHEVTSSKDLFVTLAQKAIGMLSLNFLPGSVLVNTFPLLRHIPDWFPGTEFKRLANHCAEICQEICDVPFARVKAEMVFFTSLEKP